MSKKYTVEKITIRYYDENDQIQEYNTDNFAELFFDSLADYLKYMKKVPADMADWEIDARVSNRWWEPLDN